MCRERWDRRYAEAVRLHSPDPSPFLESVLSALPGGDALDLAMGEGRNAVFLAERGWRVTGVDISTVAAVRARALARTRGVRIEAVVADLGAFELGVERWDVILDFRFLDRRLFPRIVRALRPGGAFVLEHFTTEHPEVAEAAGESGFGPRDPARLLAPGEAAARVAPLAVVVHDEGVFDAGRGPAALVRLLATKA